MAYATLRSEMLDTLQRLLAEVLRLKHEGATYNRMGKAQGLLDGYMSALLDSGIATQSELLEVVRRQRAVAFGAATRESTVDAPSASETVAA